MQISHIDLPHILKARNRCGDSLRDDGNRYADVSTREMKIETVV